MPVGRGACVDRLVEIEVLADAARREIDQLAQHGLQLGDIDPVGIVAEVDVDRQRLRHADRVGELDRAAVGETGRHHVLGEIAGGIGGRAIDLGGVLAGERAAAVRGRAAVGVDDDLAPREPGVAIGTADVELAGRVDVPARILGDPARRQRLAHVRLDQLAHLVRRHGFDEVLVRDHDLGDAGRLAVLVAHRHLALGVGPEDGLLAGVPRLRDEAQDQVAVVERRRHQLGGVLAGVAEHDALVARALILVAAAVDALRDVSRLGMQQHLDVALVPVEAILLVADVLDGEARDVSHPIPGNDVGAARLARDHDLVGRCQRLAGHAQLPGVHTGDGPLAKEQVDDLVGNAIADFVRVPLGNRLAREQKRLAQHVGIPLRWMDGGDRKRRRPLAFLAVFPPGVKAWAACPLAGLGQWPPDTPGLMEPSHPQLFAHFPNSASRRLRTSGAG